MEVGETLGSYYGVGQRSEVAKIIPKLKNFSKVLEIGCGVGGFRKNFERDCEYWGVEPFAQAAKEAASVLFKVFSATYDEARPGLPISYFDLIVLNDVIEHINETQLFIQSLKELLAPEGLIVGSVPNVRFSDNLYRMLVLKDWHYIENGILDRTHLRFFTKKSLIRFFSETGCELKIIRGIGKPVLSFESGRQFIYTVGLKVIPLIFGKDAAYLQYAFLVGPIARKERLK
jgi:2-polyprenyl-3-methyl-5-hydroxy-6-metoxy-1,4-benzoquinol methylase